MTSATTLPSCIASWASLHAADDGRLRQRRIHDTVLAELAEQAFGDAEDPAVDSDVLAEDQHRVVFGHFLCERKVQGLGHGEL
jgi:hypothetical protein